MKNLYDKNKKIRVNLRIDLDLFKDVMIYANYSNNSLSEIIRVLLEKSINDLKHSVYISDIFENGCYIDTNLQKVIDIVEKSSI